MEISIRLLLWPGRWTWILIQRGNIRIHIGRVPKMVGFPNNHGFSYTQNDHFGVFWGYHHLRKHPYRKHSCDRLKIPMAVRRPTLSSNSSWFILKQRSAYGKPGLSVWGQYLSSWLVSGAWRWQQDKYEQNNKQNQNEIQMLSNMVCSWFCWCKSNRICKLNQTILRWQKLKELTLQCATPACSLAVWCCLFVLHTLRMAYGMCLMIRLQ